MTSKLTCFCCLFLHPLFVGLKTGNKQAQHTTNIRSSKKTLSSTFFDYFHDVFSFWFMDYWKGINALCGRHPHRVVGAGGVIAPPNFGRSVNPISTKWPIMPTTLLLAPPPPFESSDLPTALPFSVFSYLAMGQITANSPTYVASPRGWKQNFSWNQSCVKKFLV